MYLFAGVNVALQFLHLPSGICFDLLCTVTFCDEIYKAKREGVRLTAPSYAMRSMASVKVCVRDQGVVLLIMHLPRHVIIMRSSLSSAFLTELERQVP